MSRKVRATYSPFAAGQMREILQLKIATDVTANPFSVTFESLDGLTVTGVWNADLSRIEF